MGQDKKTSDSRRRLLKSLAAGGGAWATSAAVPEKWSSPVVDALVLPAHAQTTGAFRGNTSLSVDVDISDGSLMDAVVPEGLAILPSVTFDCYVNATPNGTDFDIDAAFIPMMSYGGDDVSDDIGFLCVYPADRSKVGTALVELSIGNGCDDGVYQFSMQTKPDRQGRIRIEHCSGGVGFSPWFPFQPGTQALPTGPCCKFKAICAI